MSEEAKRWRAFTREAENSELVELARETKQRLAARGLSKQGKVDVFPDGTTWRLIDDSWVALLGVRN